MAKITRELLDQYHEGRCTPEEQLSVEAWLNEPETEVYLPEPDRVKQIEEQIWKRITPELSRRKAAFYNTSAGNLWNFISIAAMLVVVCGICLWPHRQQPVTLQSVSAAYGKKVQMQLPDGTKVYLNSGSILYYPIHFERDRRKVILHGEAFFDVRHDAERPFYVEAGKSLVKVLGTRFNLKAYKEDKVVLVAVEKGKIQFSETGKSGPVLTAHQQAVLKNHQLTVFHQQDAAVASWKDNILRFDNTPLKEAIPVLERWYNIQIRLKDPRLGEQRWSGTFQNPSLLKLLHFLHLTANVSYTLHDHTLTLFEE